MERDEKLYFRNLAGVNSTAVACFLYNRDITNFDPLKRPKTRASQLAKERGLDPFQRFIVEILEKGQTPAVEQKEVLNTVMHISTMPIVLPRDSPSGWHPKEALYNAFKEGLKLRNDKYVADKFSSKNFWMHVHKDLPAMNDDLYRKRAGAAKTPMFCFPALGLLRENWKKKCTHWTFDDEEEEEKKEAKDADEKERETERVIAEELASAIDAGDRPLDDLD